MGIRSQNDDAYEVLADLVVTIRRIIHRGLEKASGKTWYLDGLPDGLFERLVARKERETAIDRFAREYQELITFASLDELASIVEYNEDLRRLLASLEPEGEPMIERLREIEGLRLKLAASVPFDDEDLETLFRYHREFRESLARRKAGGEPTPAPTPEPSAQPQYDTQEPAPPQAEAASSSEEPQPPASERTAPLPSEQPDPASSAAEAAPSSGEPETAAPSAGGRSRPEFSTQAVTFEELVDVVGGVRRGNDESAGAGNEGAGHSSVIDDARTKAAELIAAAIGESVAATAAVTTSESSSDAAPEERTEFVERRAVDREAPLDEPTSVDAERAMAADDDREVLSLLHREITVVADRAFNGGLGPQYPVWEAVRSSGWFDLKKGDLALAPLELFYDIAERAREAQAAEPDREAVRQMLRESGFSKLLLSLREIFLRHSC